MTRDKSPRSIVLFYVLLVDYEPGKPLNFYHGEQDDYGNPVYSNELMWACQYNKYQATKEAERLRNYFKDLGDYGLHRFNFRTKCVRLG